MIGAFNGDPRQPPHDTQNFDPKPFLRRGVKAHQHVEGAHPRLEMSEDPWPGEIRKLSHEHANAI